MGRKKRKVAAPDAEPGIDSVTANGTGSTHVNVVPPPPPPPPPPVDPRMRAKTFLQQKQEDVTVAPSSLQTPAKSPANNNSQDDAKKMSSGYATTSHSAEIIEEDIYVSDGSESDEDLMADKLHIMSQQSTSSDDNADDSGNAVTSNIAGRSIEMVLSGSKMGLMRRGIHRPTQLVQPNRQWARQTPQDKDEKPETSGDVADDDDDPAAAEERRKREQEEELAKLDPAQRAARLLAEKQRKLEEAKILARKLESEENAGRDPCLFSKRTSFDIRFDQIDDKPWERGAGDVTDFFNYGFSEEDWLEYAEQQLLIRQELIDANRLKRIPDPSIVPVIPKKPKVQAPRVAVSGSNTEANEEDKSSDGANNNDNKNEDENVPTVLGPLPKKGTSEQVKTEKNASVEGPPSNEGPSSSSNDLPDVAVGVGGAWGVGAAPGSVLAKLIEEQDKQQRQEETQDPTQSEGMSPRKGNNKYENDAPSYYGNGGASESGGGYNDNQPDQQNNHHYGRSNQNSQQDDGSRYNNNEGSRNSRYQNKGGHYDRNNPGNHNNGEWNSRNNDRGQHHQGWNDGGRGGYRGGNRGGSGRRGGGDYGDGKGRKRGNNYSDRNDYQRHKRPREDYDDRYSRR